ncbi:MAG: flagellar biosynthetic protein FliP, partial [Gammaproteobacteria bacterium]
MIRGLLILILSLLPMIAGAEPGIPAVTVTTAEGGGQSYTVTLQILALMTILTLLPSALIMMTSFTRIIIVLAILRQAMGVQSTPSNQVLIGLSLFLTFFIMHPVFDNAYQNGVKPYIDGG